MAATSRAAGFAIEVPPLSIIMTDSGPPPRERGTGRYLPRTCPDLNCGGSTVAGADRFGSPSWHCDGLTHQDDDGPLFACPREHPR